MMRWLCMLFLLLPVMSQAQGVATLVADTVEVTSNDRLIASGNVEALYDGTRLSARRIVYDRAADQLIIDGPIYIQSPDGTILTADRASLDPRMENGLLRGARLVLDQQMQLAANQIDRIDGRFSQLSQVAATSCQICGTQAPLWDIRAQRVVHDQDAQQLYFENATFRVRGTPIFWLPYMRLPDPTLTRATGFLIPRLRTTDQLSTGVKIPYFVRLNDYSDITLTPYLSTETSTIEAAYRQAFLAGDIAVQAAASDDTLTDDLRSYLFASGQFDLGRDYMLDFTFQTVSDDAYLLDYGISDLDRLESSIAITRVRDSDLLQAQVTYFESLRDDEANTTLPPIVTRLSYDRRIVGIAGGTLDFGISADGALRTNPAKGEDGRDVARLGAQTAWQRDWILPAGLKLTANTGVQANWFTVNDDPGIATVGLQTIPQASVTLQWPLIRRSADGATDLIIPTVALAWSDQFGGTPPNEDSTRAELDQGNLFALSRFPGDDRTETGLRAATGVTWTRNFASGMTTSLTFGRVIRQEPDTGFSTSSGLTGRASDWLLAGQIATDGGFFFEARSLFDDNRNVTRGSARVDWQTNDLNLAAAYIWQAADATESRPEAVSEWTLDTTVQVTDAWAVSVDTRYDIAADSPARAGLGVEWRNECVTVDLSVSRRYTSSTTVEPSTDYGLRITLNGFSAGRSNGGPAARCTN